MGRSTALAVQLRFGNETASEVTKTSPQALKRDRRTDGSYARLKAVFHHRLYSRCETAIEEVMKRIAILGSTGSIGKSTLSIVESFPDRFSVVSMAAGNNVELAFEQARRWRPQILSMATAEAAEPTPRQAEEGRTGQRHRSRARIGRYRSGSRLIPTPTSWSAPSSASPDWKPLTKRSKPARPSAWRTKNAWSPRAT